MANSTATYGLVPVSNLSGELRSIKCVGLAAYGTALYVGDPVILGGDGLGANPSVIIAVGSAGTASPNIFGVITSIEASDPDSLNTQGGTASTARNIMVQPALNSVIFRVHSTDGMNTADLGNGFDLTAAAGTASIGRSNWVLQGGTGGTTGKQCRLIGFDNRPDNSIGASGSNVDDTDCLVIITESLFNNGAGI